MQIAISLRERLKVNALASSVFALNALAFVMTSPAAAFTSYVSNEKGNSISIIDTGKMEVTKTVPVGHRPRGIALSQGRRRTLHLRRRRRFDPNSKHQETLDH